MSRPESSRLALVMFIVLTLTLPLSTTVSVVISQTQQRKQTPAYIYTVLGPNVIRPHFTYKVSVSIVARENASASSSVSLVPVVVIASIVDGRDGKTWYNSDAVTLHPGNNTNTFLQVAIGNLSFKLKSGRAARSYRLAVTGTTLGDALASDKPPSLPLFEGQADLRVVQGPKNCHHGTDSTLLLIHTDKPIYKPGEVVRFRVLVLTSALKPYSNFNSSFETPLLTISVFDPRQNVIKTWPGVTALPDGIFQANLTLSAEPVLGDWVIQVQLSSQSSKTKTKTLSFSVDQYVLPKFDVELLLPSFATFDGPHSRVTAQVKASYTYGKAVQTGHVVVTIGEKHTFNYHHGSPDLEEEEDIIPGGRVPRMVSPSPLVTKTVQLVDGTAFADFELAKDLNLQGHGDTMRTIRVNATVVESLTGKRATATSTIMVHKHAYKLALISPNYYKPGLPFTVTVAVTHQDGSPVHDERSDALVVRHPFSYTDEGSVYKVPVPVTGLVPLTFTPPSNEQLEVRGFEVAYKGVKQWFGLPERVTTASKVYLNLVQLEGTVNEDDKHVQVVRVKVESNKPFQTVHYQMVSKSKHGIAQLLTESSGTNTKTLPTSRKETTLEFGVPMTQSVTETVTLVAYILADTDVDEEPELISDSIEIQFKAGQESKSKLELNNHLNVKLSGFSAEPGQNVTLELGTRHGSLVALRAVDQSVLLLKEGRDHDIDLKSVGDEIESLRDQDNGNDYYFGSSFHSSHAHAHSAHVFEKAGLVLMTNAKLQQPNYRHGGGGFEEDEQEISAGGFVPPNATPAKPAPTPIRVRSHFPETWIWEEIQTVDGHYFNKTFQVPDTLTSWIITGYSIHPEHGLGLLRVLEKLTVVRPFFVTLNVPHSAVRGEVLAVQVLVHNYLGHEAEVEVTLDNARQQFEFFNEPNGASSPSVGIKSVTVASSSIGSVTFIIVPTQFGTIELAVKGVASTVNGQAGDALSRPLVVKPPGQRHTVNKVALIDHRIQNTTSTTLEAIFPDGRVPGAGQLRLSVVSDILGPTIANLGDLLQMPYGCGEQNLVNFVPDIVILDYLTKTGQVESGIQAKALLFLESGYQRQLTYAHEDGSFSAFGASDKHGSTWLTAFTIKSFHAAKLYISVDEKVIGSGLRFLEGQQSDDGSFKEPGRVLHSGLQGGSGKGLALTAYVLLAFVEVTKGTATHKAVTDKGLKYLVSQLSASRNSSVSQDLYGLVLAGYVLELAKHPMRGQIATLVEKHAKTSTDGEFKYWEEPQDPKTGTSKTKPLSVEMSSYRLLTYLAQNGDSSLTAALPVVKWLLAQRNAAGGFISTQDTVVGLAALAKFAEIAQGSTVDAVNLNITAKYGTGASNFHVDSDNAIVFQTQELPSDIRTVTLQAIGHGMALVQLTSTYYVENVGPGAPDQQFQVDVKVNRLTTASKELLLEICTRFIRNDGAPSNMAVLEVNLPTGYVFDAERYKMGGGDAELLALLRVMRVDLAESDTQLNIYYDHILSSELEPPSCVSLRANSVHGVAKQSPAYVRVYDYYDTTRTGQASYEAPNLGHGLCASDSDGDRVNKANCI